MAGARVDGTLMPGDGAANVTSNAMLIIFTGSTALALDHNPVQFKLASPGTVTYSTAVWAEWFYESLKCDRMTL